jgi:flagellar basal-body rod protein FlgB
VLPASSNVYGMRAKRESSWGLTAMAADLFALAERKLEWIDQRQRVLAQNIANADTPAYQARDLSPFEKLLNAAPVTPALTNPLHLAEMVSEASMTQALPTEKAPDGNAVNVENELTKVAQDETQSALVGNLWKSYMGLYLSALGRSG